jgi:cytidylate kinase
MEMEKRLIIAIDGYSSCGKSTFAREIASELNYIYIDSGAMYRAVTLYCIRKGYVDNGFPRTGDIIEDLGEIHISFVYNPDIGSYETFLNSENVEREIRSIEVSSHVSRISQIHEVRARMVELQRQIGVYRGIVMDGRDIGTVVFPDADLKIFMTASVDIRAKRRYDELRGRNIDVDLEEVRMNIIARDIADENRDISPLRRADDAILLDNSRMTVDQQMNWVMKIIRQKINENRN